MLPPLLPCEVRHQTFERFSDLGEITERHGFGSGGACRELVEAALHGAGVAQQSRRLFGRSDRPQRGQPVS